MKRADVVAFFCFLIVVATGVSGGLGYRIGCQSIKPAACQCGDKCECCECGESIERGPIEAGPLRDGFRHWRTASALHTTLIRLEVEGKLSAEEAAAVKLVRTDAKAFAALHAKVNDSPITKGYVEANGDFLKWLLTAFWNNRDEILKFIMEIVKIFRGQILWLSLAGYC